MQLFLDDFRPGQTFASRSTTLTQRHFAIFAEMTGDHHPIHYDEDYARSKGWKAPLAHGLLLAGLCAVGAAPLGEELEESMIAMLGNEMSYKRPAFIGDTVTARFSVLSVEPKDNTRGVLRLAIALHNQRGEVVLEGAHSLMLRRRATI
jgi:acyl dehydratase